MFLALMIAGTAQANPLIIGITLLPLSPTLRISLSVRKLMRAIYPESSRMLMSPKRIIICGTNITMPPTPARTPLIKRSDHHASGKTAFNQAPAWANVHSIKFIGYSASQKILWNNRNSTTSRIIYPQCLCSSMSSSLSVKSAFLSGLGSDTDCFKM